MIVHSVDATGVRSATGTGQDKDKSGLTTYNAGASRRGLVIAVTEDGALIIVDIMKTSPLLAIMIR